VLAYDADYDHSEARISADGSTVMLFRYTGFRIYDLDGEVVAEAELPIPEGDQVYDQQYRRDEAGSRLEVTTAAQCGPILPRMARSCGKNPKKRRMRRFSRSF